MDALAIGPVLLSLERLYALAAVVLFIVGAEWLARKHNPRFSRWSTYALLAGFVGARLVYVLSHLDAFRQEPLAVLYVWQGGFAASGALGGVALLSLWYWRRQWRALRLALLPPAAAGLLWLALMQWQPLQSAQAAQRLPELSLFDLQHQPVQLASFRGQPLVVNLWATWCLPCRREMPLFAELESRYPDIRFVFINTGDSLLQVTDFLRQEQLTLRHVLLDPQHASLAAFQAPGLPATLFFNAAGEPVGSHVGEISRAALQAQLAALRP